MTNFEYITKDVDTCISFFNSLYECDECMLYEVCDNYECETCNEIWAQWLKDERDTN